MVSTPNKTTFPRPSILPLYRKVREAGTMVATFVIAPLVPERRRADFDLSMRRLNSLLLFLWWANRRFVAIPDPVTETPEQAETMKRITADLASAFPEQERGPVKQSRQGKLYTFPDYGWGKSIRDGFIGLLIAAFFVGLIWLCAGGWAKFVPEEWTR